MSGSSSFKIRAREVVGNEIYGNMEDNSRTTIVNTSPTEEVDIYNFGPLNR